MLVSMTDDNNGDDISDFKTNKVSTTKYHKYTRTKPWGNPEVPTQLSSLSWATSVTSDGAADSTVLSTVSLESTLTETTSMDITTLTSTGLGIPTTFLTSTVTLPTPSQTEETQIPSHDHNTSHDITPAAAGVIAAGVIVSVVIITSVLLCRGRFRLVFVKIKKSLALRKSGDRAARSGIDGDGVADAVAPSTPFIQHRNPSMTQQMESGSVLHRHLSAESRLGLDIGFPELGLFPRQSFVRENGTQGPGFAYCQSPACRSSNRTLDRVPSPGNYAVDISHSPIFFGSHSQSARGSDHVVQNHQEPFSPGIVQPMQRHAQSYKGKQSAESSHRSMRREASPALTAGSSTLRKTEKMPRWTSYDRRGEGNGLSLDKPPGAFEEGSVLMSSLCGGQDPEAKYLPQGYYGLNERVVSVGSGKGGQRAGEYIPGQPPEIMGQEREGNKDKLDSEVHFTDLPSMLQEAGEEAVTSISSGYVNASELDDLARSNSPAPERLSLHSGPARSTYSSTILVMNPIGPDQATNNENPRASMNSYSGTQPQTPLITPAEWLRQSSSPSPAQGSPGGRNMSVEVEAPLSPLEALMRTQVRDSATNNSNYNLVSAHWMVSGSSGGMPGSMPPAVGTSRVQTWLGESWSPSEFVDPDEPSVVSGVEAEEGEDESEEERSWGADLRTVVESDSVSVVAAKRRA